MHGSDINIKKIPFAVHCNLRPLPKGLVPVFFAKYKHVADWDVNWACFIGWEVYTVTYPFPPMYNWALLQPASSFPLPRRCGPAGNLRGMSPKTTLLPVNLQMKFHLFKPYGWRLKHRSYSTVSVTPVFPLHFSRQSIAWLSCFLTVKGLKKISLSLENR